MNLLEFLFVYAYADILIGSKKAIISLIFIIVWKNKAVFHCLSVHSLALLVAKTIKKLYEFTHNIVFYSFAIFCKRAAKDKGGYGAEPKAKIKYNLTIKLIIALSPESAKHKKREYKNGYPNQTPKAFDTPEAEVFFLLQLRN